MGREDNPEVTVNVVFVIEKASLALLVYQGTR
jgi:hypothetical protein